MYMYVHEYQHKTYDVRNFCIIAILMISVYCMGSHALFVCALCAAVVYNRYRESAKVKELFSLKGSFNAK